MAQTIKTIISEMADVVRENKPMSPDFWINKAIDLTVLWGEELKPALLDAEIKHKQEVSLLIEEGLKVNAAELKVAATSENYRVYKYLEGRDKIIKEFIMIAKKRATIEREFNY